jgi:hypothetical protein
MAREAPLFQGIGFFQEPVRIIGHLGNIDGISHSYPTLYFLVGLYEFHDCIAYLLFKPQGSGGGVSCQFRRWIPTSGSSFNFP